MLEQLEEGIVQMQRYTIVFACELTLVVYILLS